MSDSAAFDWICTELETASSLDRLEARGTVRIALRQSGLDVRTVTPDQMQVVIERVLPGELQARGIDEAGSICTKLGESMKREDLGSQHAPESPDEIFRRLGGGK